MHIKPKQDQKEGEGRGEKSRKNYKDQTKFVAAACWGRGVQEMEIRISLLHRFPSMSLMSFYQHIQCPKYIYQVLTCKGLVKLANKRFQSKSIRA